MRAVEVCTAKDVQALVADGMRDLRDYYDAVLEWGKFVDGLDGARAGVLLLGALAVAFGGEVMVSGFAFGEMIRANILNWPLAFHELRSVRRRPHRLCEYRKEREFWGRAGLASP